MSNQVEIIEGVPMRVIDQGDGTFALPVSVTGSLANQSVQVISNQVVAAGATCTSSQVDLLGFTGVAAIGYIAEAVATTPPVLYIQAALPTGSSYWLTNVNYATNGGPIGLDSRLRYESKISVGFQNKDSIAHTVTAWRRDFILY